MILYFDLGTKESQQVFSKVGLKARREGRGKIPHSALGNLICASIVLGIGQREVYKNDYSMICKLIF